MKKLVLTAALLGASALAAPSAHATGYFDLDAIMDYMAGCETLCDPARADIRQGLSGIQDAMNQIVNVKDATDIVQKSVNAGNLVTVISEDDNGVPTWILNKELGTVLQVSNTTQLAHNLIDGGKSSDFYNLTQAATNVVNSVTGKTAWNINQNVSNLQSATNTIYGGAGGYDADDIADWDADDVKFTQTAVNAANLIDIATLKNDIVQGSSVTQDAINTASFESEKELVWTKWGFDFKYTNPTVYDFGQSATNVTNSVTVGEIQLGSKYGAGCACGYEIDQSALADQYAANSLIFTTLGNVNNAIQSATNVANSISVPSGN